jgi:spore maturation protein SpmA
LAGNANHAHRVPATVFALIAATSTAMPILLVSAIVRGAAYGLYEAIASVALMSKTITGKSDEYCAR